tara:strand:+ start:363 stop:527 length:165 start_codon:yes stop_codon:yes gene_type:complete
MNIDDLRDLSIAIVGNLVLAGLVEDCTDTNTETEFEIQDSVLETLCNKFNITNI